MTLQKVQTGKQQWGKLKSLSLEFGAMFSKVVMSIPRLKKRSFLSKALNFILNKQRVFFVYFKVGLLIFSLKIGPQFAVVTHLPPIFDIRV